MTSLVYRDRRAIMGWLIVCCLLVAGMVVIGGYTRLSGSGLSITQWKPLHGTFPPGDAQAWQEEFSAYQQSPQYRKVNKGMSMEEFRKIYWPEYIHRLLGRVAGAVFFIPLLVFALRRSFCARLGWRLAGIFALGGLQGGIGWLMVASGLVDDPNVSPLRLALHLGVALTIFSLILWTLLDIAEPWKGQAAVIPAKSVRVYGLWMVGLAAQIMLGALMAGLHAGLVYNTWPTMNGQWIPDGLLSDSVTLVQFLHRNLALLLVFTYAFWWYFQRRYVKNTPIEQTGNAILIALLIQINFGVMTLLYHVPLNAAFWHQWIALGLLGYAVALLHGLLTLRIR